MRGRGRGRRFVGVEWVASLRPQRGWVGQTLRAGVIIMSEWVSECGWMDGQALVLCADGAGAGVSKGSSGLLPCDRSEDGLVRPCERE